MASPEGGMWHRVNGAQPKKAKDREVVSLRRPAVPDLPSGLESPDSCKSPQESHSFGLDAAVNAVPLRMQPVTDAKPPVKDFVNQALSDDLLASVLSCLTSSKDRAAFSQVCKRWCDLEGALHTRVRFPGGKQLAEQVTRALTRFPNLVEVTVDERAVKKSFWRRGNASKAAMEAAMRQVARSCATLEKLNFYSCAALTDRMLQDVVAECASLRSLRLVRCEKVGKSHKKRFKSGGALEPESRSRSPETMSPHFVTACANNLVQLNLYGTGVDDAAVAAIGHYCKGLERLSLAGCHDVTDSGLKLLVEGCKKLQDLNVVRCWRVTDKGLAAIGEGCGSTIKFLSLGFHSEVHDRGLRALATGCPHLELLAISDCNNMTDAGVRTVVRRCKRLRILKVTACLQVKDVSLDLIGRLASSLEILELRSLIITDRALAHLAAAGGSPALKRLVLAGCPYITDKGLMALAAQESFSLRSVDVRHCREVSTPALARFMVRCATLEQMDVDKGRTEELDTELQKLRASLA